MKSSLLVPQEGKCSSFVVLITDITKTGFLLGNQSISRVVVLTDATIWKIKEFLSISRSQGLVNLLVVANSYTDGYKRDINLYTHGLWLDTAGSSAPQIVASWRRGRLSRPGTNLFPKKVAKGFNGFQFTVSVRHQPPFVVKRNRTGTNGKEEFYWDGLEIRLLRLLSDRMNFSLLIQEPPNVDSTGVEVIGVVQELFDGRADIGAAGMYITPDRVNVLDMSKGHTIDCAAFITLTSTALPRYRAIMGPFHWKVWMALTLVYFFAIFPLAFSYRHSLKHLWRDPWEVENMFWYVFGTFTNCFTFVGSKSWSTSTKHTTRLIVGVYWLFSIIITACYTGSVIAFITLPVFPAVVDTSQEIYDAGYTVGTLSGGGWKEWFQRSADPITNKILEKIEYVPDGMAGLKNVTSNYFWPYAFLGSRAWLSYVVRANFSVGQSYKRALLHIGSECFVPFHVALAFPPKATYAEKIDQAVLRVTQAGLMMKLLRDVEWEVQRSATGKLLQAGSGSSLRFARPEERRLTLDDCQGIFLLLGAGFLIAAAILVVENVSARGKKKYMEKHKQQPAFVVSHTYEEEEQERDAIESMLEYTVYNSQTLSLDNYLEEKYRLESSLRERRVQTS